ncbi:MAG: hypothetical protein JST48_01690 [Bacteroidetes bacterium]|nr:hypothetical protein [Bacteroidota bacterium]
MENQQPEKKKMTLRDFFSLGEVGAYFFRKKKEDRPTNINIKMMHGVNRLAIIMFLLGMIYFIIKRFFL